MKNPIILKLIIQSKLVEVLEIIMGTIDVSSIAPVVYSSLDRFFLAVRSIFGSSDILFHHV